jgi:hypothetical protein
MEIYGKLLLHKMLEIECSIYSCDVYISKQNHLLELELSIYS